MTTISCALNISNPLNFARNPGVSEYAAKIRQESDEFKQSFARTISFGEGLSQILEGLERVRQEYSEDNWDGYGAKGIDKQSLENALGFALALPSAVNTPQIDVMPSGQVAFIWSEGTRRVFSVIIGSTGELFYAGLYGATKTYGVEYFNDDISDVILENINRVYS